MNNDRATAGWVAIIAALLGAAIYGCSLLLPDAEAGRRRGPRANKTPLSAAAASDPDASLPPDGGEMFAMGAWNQSNGWTEAFDTDAGLTSAIDAQVWRGGSPDASTVLPEAVQGTGVGGTGLSVYSEDVVIARELARMNGTWSQTLIPAVAIGGNTLAQLQASSEFTGVPIALETSCTARGGSGCFMGYLIGDHGESDEAADTATYGDDLITYKDALYANIPAGWLNIYRPKVFFSALGNWAGQDSSRSESLIIPQQITAANADSDLVLIAGNDHYGKDAISIWNEPNNQVHLNEGGQLRKGEFYARIIDLYLNGLMSADIVMYPTNVTVSGANIDIDYTGTIPCIAAGDCDTAALEFDTTAQNCAWTGVQTSGCRYGFTFEDTNPLPAILSSVSVVDNDTIRLTLDKNVPTTGGTWSYRRYAPPLAMGGSGHATSTKDWPAPRGNLRDSTLSTGGISGDETVAWANPVIGWSVAGSRTPDSHVAYWSEDLNATFGFLGEDCVDGTGNQTLYGSAGATWTNVSGSITCDQTTGDAPTDYIGTVNTRIDPDTNSKYSASAPAQDADDDIIVIWSGCATASANSEYLFRWYFGATEHFAINKGTTNVLTFTHNTTGNSGGSIVDNSAAAGATGPWPSTGSRPEAFAYYLSRRHLDDQQKLVECHRSGASSSTCVFTNKNVARADIRAGTFYLFANQTAANYWQSPTYDLVVLTGEQARAFKQTPEKFAEWWSTAYAAFISAAGDSCDAELMSKSGFRISDLVLAHSDVEATLSIPEPPDASVSYVDGGGGAYTISASNTWIDCSGTTLGGLTISSGVDHVYIANCNFVGASGVNIDGTNDHLEIYNSTFSHTGAGVQTFVNIGDNWLLNQVTMEHNDDYAWFASDFDEATMSSNVIVYNSRFKGGPTQSTVRLDGLNGTAWVGNRFAPNASTNPHNLRFQGGTYPDAGSGDTGSFGAHLAEVKDNCMMGGSNVRICNLNTTEVCGTIYFRENDLYSNAGTPDPMDINCDQIGSLQMYGNSFSRINSSYNPWNQSTGGCVPDANTLHDYDAATFPDGGCTF